MKQKEQNKNPTVSPKEEKPKTPLTEEQRQRRRKMLVYPLMGLLFIGSMWLIFAPSDKDKDEAQQGVGFNTEMPLPVEAGIIADKRTAYEQARLEEKQKERRTQMNDLAALFSDKEDEAETQTEEFDLLNPEPEQPARTYGGGSRPRQPIRSSAAAYEDINRTLGTFYETPKDDPEKEELRERIEELEAMMARQAEPSGSTLDDQVALLEKSYELAAKYMPAGQGGTSRQPSAADTEEDKKTVRNGKAVAQPVGQVAERIVSALAQHMTDSEFITAQTEERNFGFQTAVGTSSAVGRNTISAASSEQVMRIDPAGLLRNSERLSSSSPICLISGPTDRTSLSPASVVATSRVVLDNSLNPSLSSSPLMAWLRAEGETPSLSAAFVKLLSFATTIKACKSFRFFMPINEFFSQDHAVYAALSNQSISFNMTARFSEKAFERQNMNRQKTPVVYYCGSGNIRRP